MKSLTAMLAVTLICISAGGQGGSVSAQSSKEWLRTKGSAYVPDETTAIAVSEAVLVPIHGRDKTQSERPFHAKLNRELDCRGQPCLKGERGVSQR